MQLKVFFYSNAIKCVLLRIVTLKQFKFISYICICDHKKEGLYHIDVVFGIALTNFAINMSCFLSSCSLLSLSFRLAVYVCIVHVIFVQ